MHEGKMHIALPIRKNIFGYAEAWLKHMNLAPKMKKKVQAKMLRLNIRLSQTRNEYTVKIFTNADSV